MRNLRASLERVRRDLVPDAMAIQRYDIPKPPENGGGFEVRFWSPLNAPVLDSDRQLAYIIHRVEDVTDFVHLKQQEQLTADMHEQTGRLEKENYQRTQQVAEASRQLKDANAMLSTRAHELQEFTMRKSQFLANMSHELRTPLNGIIGFAEMLHDGIVPRDGAQAIDCLAEILASGRHLLDLVNDVLDLSKVEAGKLEFEPQRIHLSILVHVILGSLRPKLSTRQVLTEIASEVDEVMLDAKRLRQVLLNFISNAIKFTPDDGRIAIRVSAVENDRVKIEVEDSGIGITIEDQRRLFSEFEQIRDGAQREGTGLGLALVKRLVEAQGGTVGVRSTRGVGSVFHAIFPRSLPG